MEASRIDDLRLNSVKKDPLSKIRLKMPVPLANFLYPLNITLVLNTNHNKKLIKQNKIYFLFLFF